MIRQFRIDRFNGIEFLVCEVYFKHTWTKSENDAYSLYLEQYPSPAISRSEFRCLLDGWLSREHGEGETFYGLLDPIPVIEMVPHLVLRGAIVNNRIASLHADYMESVTPQVVMDSVSYFYAFMRSPHWRNTIATSISNYGSLFATQDNS